MRTIYILLVSFVLGDTKKRKKTSATQIYVYSYTYCSCMRSFGEIHIYKHTHNINDQYSNPKKCN